MPDLPDVESLRLLVLVGRRGSLTAAAGDLGITQPSASKRLRALERRLGLTLVDRDRRGSLLTPAGTVVSGWATRVLDDLDVLLDGVAALRRERSDRLTIAASLTVAEHLMPGWIGALRRTHADLHVGLQVVNSARVCELVAQGAVDIGFIESPDPVPGLPSITVAHDRLLLVVPPGHAWTRRERPVGVAEIVATPLVSREPGSGTRETADRALRAAGATGADPLMELGSGTAVRTAVAGGAGPALISELAVGSDLATGALVEVPTTGLDLRRALRALWRTGDRPPAAAADLLSVIPGVRPR